MIGYLLEQALGNELPAGAGRDAADPGRRRPRRPGVRRPDEADRPDLRPRSRRAAGRRARAGRSRPDGAVLPPRRRLAEPHRDRRDRDDPAPARRRRRRRLRRRRRRSRSSSTAAAGLRGVEAVIDKDLSAALLAEKLGADFLLMLTDVPAVERWTGGRPTRVPSTPPRRRSCARCDFAAGSMGPKVEAACRFVERDGRVRGHRPARPGRRDPRAVRPERSSPERATRGRGSPRAPPAAALRRRARPTSPDAVSRGSSRCTPRGSRGAPRRTVSRPGT